MYEAIKNFHKQFLYEPKIENLGHFVKKSRFLVVGMGGSGLAPKLIKSHFPDLEIIIHQDYGLPLLSDQSLQDSLIILSSYSGNTEEVIEAFYQAKDKKLDMVVIAVGGELLNLAQENKIPYILLPNTGIQPRSALGYSVKAFMKFIGNEKDLQELSKLADILDPSLYEQDGKNLAKKLKNYVPIIYTSRRNEAIGYNWKIKLNETGKIPAFSNVLPELNHNEMTSFDVADSTKSLSNNFFFLILKDKEDHPQIQKRMSVLEKLYKKRNLRVEIKDIEGESSWQKVFASLVLADFVAYYTAMEYGLESEQVPMVEEFKKLILE
jgi:glucose/mannose-6-phosphate isomerase